MSDLTAAAKAMASPASIREVQAILAARDSAEASRLIATLQVRLVDRMREAGLNHDAAASVAERLTAKLAATWETRYGLLGSA